MPPLRAIAPFRGIVFFLLLALSMSSADRQAAAASSNGAEAAPVVAAPAPSPSSSSSPPVSAKDALGSNAPSDAAFLFTIVSRKATLEADPKVRDDLGIEASLLYRN